jgi:primosomal protein N'
MLVIAPRAVKIQAMVYQWVRHVTQAEGWPSSVRVQIDVDPYSFL